MTTVWLVRHAEAEGNLCRRIHGHFDSNVTRKGMQQIKQLKERFAQIPVDVCYSSDLTRTVTTAQAICIPNRLTLCTDSVFREVNLGEWEDCPFGYLGVFDSENLKNFNNDPKNWHVKGSEPYKEYTDRFLSALKHVCKQHRGKSIAIVSHGAVLRGLFMELFPHMEAGHSDNTAVSKIILEDGMFHPVFLNDNSHLTEETSTFAKQNWWKGRHAKEDDALWFREQEKKLHYDACLGNACVGTVVCKEDGDRGVVERVELLEAYRGKGFAVQMLGQAIFQMRSLGKKSLILPLGGSEPLRAASRKLYFTEDELGNAVLDLKISVRVLE